MRPATTVDPRRPRARREGPVRHPIAHGYLTLSLLPVLTEQIYSVKSAFGVNYGANKVRFPHPVPVDSRAARHRHAQGDRGHRDRHPGLITVVVELDGVEKPACIADVVYVIAGA